MFDLIKIFISFVLTGFVGVFVSYYFQRKNALSQLVFKQAERKAIELKEIRDKFEQLAGERVYRAKILIGSLSSNTVAEKDRETYRESVASWNKNLNALFFDLKAQGLYGVSLEVERNVQRNFYNSHVIIKKELEKIVGKPENMDAALASVNAAYSNASDISDRLTAIADKRWDEIKNSDTIGLTAYNLERASTLILLVALFHKAPHSLRISRSRVDS